MKKSKISVAGIFGGVFLLIGIVFILICLISTIAYNKFKESAEKCNAVITNIESYYDSNSETTEYDVYVRYEVDDVVYDKELNYYESGMVEGDIITIYYNVDDPNDIMADGDATLFLIFGIIGAIFAIIGVVCLIVVIRGKKIKKRIIAMNCIIQAQIGGIEPNYSVSVNGKHPFLLTASAISPYDGKIYTFRSESFWSDLTLVLQHYNITQVPVYVNPNNYNEYYVDIDIFKQYVGN